MISGARSYAAFPFRHSTITKVAHEHDGAQREQPPLTEK